MCVCQRYVKFEPVTLATDTLDEHLLHKYTASAPFASFAAMQMPLLERHVRP
jgi:hypothetical protein